QELVERHALQVLEHHVGIAVLLADLVNDDDVLVAAPRGGAGLEDKPRTELGLVVTVEELDRDLAAELGVARGVHRAHATAPELANDLVLSDPHPDGGHRPCARYLG